MEKNAYRCEVISLLPLACPNRSNYLGYLSKKERLLMLTMRSGGLAAALHSECTRPLWSMDDKYFLIKKRNFATTCRLQGYSEHWIMFAHIGA